MNNIKILVCEDLEDDQVDIKLYIDELSQEFTNVNFTLTIKDFSDTIKELKNDYDLLILDFYDNKSKVLAGERILKHNTNKIKTVIYTSTAQQNKVDYNELKNTYKFLIGYEPKLKVGTNLKDFIRTFIFENNINEKNYSLYNDNDIFLINSIISLGESQFHEILHQLINDNLLNGTIIIHRMTSGLSGAIVFKIENNNKFSILKVSKEIEKLKKEHENSNLYYHIFPSRFVNHINPKEYYSFDKKVIGILLKDVNNSQTFFDFILSEYTNSMDIEKYLHELFLADQSLQNHYLTKRDGKRDWIHIFNKIDSLKFSLVELSFSELKLIINKFCIDLAIVDIRNLVLNNSYKNLDKTKLLDNKFQKHLVLSHGDMHAKNILVQSSKIPVIIDTGAINYEFWCIDICRLIVNLFILGFDINTIDYFDINKITDNLAIIEKIINQEPIQFDSKNDKLISSINWLTKNCNLIFGETFSKFEFQLGLMKEFLQVSYRVESVPPNKRAIALIASHKCMEIANSNVN